MEDLKLNRRKATYRLTRRPIVNRMVLPTFSGNAKDDSDEVESVFRILGSVGAQVSPLWVTSLLQNKTTV
ncbi:hypothetical protein Y032_0110g199 [Ancylostoma ceylanicum]|nr:hypothetical protein Y032_0110g199 [Ancylostoma ceylanicum]